MNNLLTRCRTMAKTIAPELDGELYVFNVEEFRDICPSPDCLGWALNTTHFEIAERMGARHTAPGPMIGLDFPAIAAAAQPGQFDSCCLNVVCHEVAHLLPRREIQAIEPTPELLEYQRLQFTIAPEELEKPDTIDVHHDHRFVRRAVHCYVRALEAGYDVPVYRLLGLHSHAESYLPALLREALAMRDCTFAEIEATEPPATLLELFEHDQVWYRNYRKEFCQ